jgi:hypothetical protein
MVTGKLTGCQMSREDDPIHFREQAEYCRLQAQKSSDPKEKAAWLKVASDWLQLAEGTEAGKRDNPL